MTRTFLKAYAQKMKKERGVRSVTPAEAEAEVVETMTRVAVKLAPKYVFSGYDVEDIRQEALLSGLEVIETKYDIERPLENFMHVHMNNRLFNLRRDEFYRSEAPCMCCDVYDPPVDPCKKYTAWFKRNARKQNLMTAVDATSDQTFSQDTTAHDETVANEITELIDLKISPELRGDYLRMRAKVSIPKSRRQKVRDELLDILGSDDA